MLTGFDTIEICRNGRHEDSYKLMRGEGGRDGWPWCQLRSRTPWVSEVEHVSACRASTGDSRRQWCGRGGEKAAERSSCGEEKAGQTLFLGTGWDPPV
ncbi:hypothetical protein CMUS01_11982 [Colletotrichum musicola]|uniref:Uncharacterized protein n=1 Tax=Colletotrichum musicola TaxID=2175873 RepID=A0A8H6JS90_9PEZI|nr:hypothetical protein CMUS01_11982 [Colletotrichum musicola]